MNRFIAIVALLSFAAFGDGPSPVTKTRLGSLHPREGLVVTDIDLSAIGGGVAGDWVPMLWWTNLNLVVGADNTCESNGVTIFGHENVATGENAVAIGNYTLSQGSHSVAVGTSESYGNYACAIGFDNIAYGKESYAGGAFSKSYSPFSVAFGYNAISSNDYASAFGAFAEATGLQSLAAGCGAKAESLNTVAIGTFAKASITNSVAIGTDAQATKYYSVALGASATADECGTALGMMTRAGPASAAMGFGLRKVGLFKYWSGASSLGMYSVAVGGYVETNAEHSVAIGSYAWVTNKNAVVISATGYVSNAPENRSHGDGTITFGVTNGLHCIYVGTNRIDKEIAYSVREAVYSAADYIWDPDTEVCYRRQMRGGFLDYVAVTNIDVRLPENYAALAALEASK